MNKLDRIVAIILAALIGCAAVALALLIIAKGLGIGGGGIIYAVILIGAGGGSYGFFIKLVKRIVWVRWPVIVLLVIGIAYLSINYKSIGFEDPIVPILIAILPIALLYMFIPDTSKTVENQASTSTNEECDADFSGTDKTGERVSHPSVEGTLQSRYGSHYTCVEVFDPLSIVPGDKDREIESKSLSLDNLNPEDKAIATDLISLGDDNPDVRYKAYNVLDQKRYKADVLLSGISRIEAEIPSNDVITRVRLYCGLGFWLGGNIYTRPKGIELIRHAIKLSTNTALPHALVGTLLMGDSSNAYLERGTSSFRQHPGLSDGELELLSKKFHNQAQEELELAIRLNPNDPTPYYVFCKSQFLDFSQLKNQYLQGVQRDKTHSPEFGGNHWSFAIKAAKFNQASDTTDAFLRAMLVEPQRYCEGPGAVRPQSGLALSCWQTAKQQVGSYQGNLGKIEAIWSVEQTVEPEPPNPAPVVQPQTPPVGPAPTPGPSKTPKRSTSPLLWIIILGGISCVCISLALLLFGQQIVALLPVGVKTPPQSTLAFTPQPGTWKATAEFGEFTFVVNSKGTGVNAYDFGGIKITTNDDSGYPIKDSKFGSMLDFIRIEGEFDSSTTASGTWEYLKKSGSGTWTAIRDGASIAETPISSPTSTPRPPEQTVIPALPTSMFPPIIVETGVPIIRNVKLRRDISSGSLVIYQDVYFSDSDGDVIRWDFEIVSTTNPDVNAEGGELDIPNAEQKFGAVVTGDWTCGSGNYSVTLSVTLTDRAGHRSAPYEYTMNCDAGN